MSMLTIDLSGLQEGLHIDGEYALGKAQASQSVCLEPSEIAIGERMKQTNSAERPLCAEAVFGLRSSAGPASALHSSATSKQGSGDDDAIWSSYRDVEPSLFHSQLKSYDLDTTSFVQPSKVPLLIPSS